MPNREYDILKTLPQDPTMEEQAEHICALHSHIGALRNLIFSQNQRIADLRKLMATYGFKDIG